MPRIIFVDTYYDAFLKTLTLGNGSYQEELDKVLARQFGTADFYSREFRKLGWEAIDIISNFDELQNRWSPGFHDNSNWHLLAAQINVFKPDVLFLQDFSLHIPEEFDGLVVGQLSSAWPGDRRVKDFHTIFTSFPHFVKRIEALGVNAVYMPLAFHESAIANRCLCGHLENQHGSKGCKACDRCPEWCRKGIPERDIDVSFVGGIGWQWKQGLEVLEAVALAIPTFQWWGYGVEQLNQNSPLRKCYKGTAWGDEMYSIYQRSKIVINRHGEIAENYANNMRMYEATGCGALVFTELKDNLRELFPLGINHYESADILVRSIKFALNHWDYAKVQAIEGQRVTLSEHTYAHRVPKIAEVLTNAMQTA